MTMGRSNPNASTLIERLPKMARRKWKMKRIRIPYINANPELFKRFLRLNNRKKTFYHEDFVNAGYYFAKTRMYIYGNTDNGTVIDSYWRLTVEGKPFKAGIGFESFKQWYREWYNYANGAKITKTL